MRPADEEPERPGDARTPTAGRRAGGRLLVPLVVAGAAVVVVSTALGGRAVVTPLELSGPFGLRPTLAPVASQPPVQPPPVQDAPTSDPLLPTLLTVLAGVVAVAVAVVLIRLVVLAVLARRRRVGLKGLHGIEAGDEQAVADAPAVLRGIAAALVALDEDRAPGDAVVRAWLGLQQAAEDAGFARGPAETPTEFTGRVLSRTGADRAALRTLLRLYLRARFGGGAITGADAADAREALRALETSWERTAAVGSG